MSETDEDALGKTRQIVGPVLIWLLVAAVIGALTDTPAWSVQLAATVAVDPWIDIGMIVSQAAMIVLVIVYIVMLIRTWRSKTHIPFIRLVFGGVATAIAYVVSTSSLLTSDHAVIAFGLAMTLAFALGWMTYIGFPLALIIGIALILSGHHEPHDVVSGGVLGLFGVLGALLMFIKVQTQMADKLSAARTTAGVSS